MTLKEYIKTKEKPYLGFYSVHVSYQRHGLEEYNELFFLDDKEIQNLLELKIIDTTTSFRDGEIAFVVKKII